MLDTTQETECNWLCLVPTARNKTEQNLMAVPIGLDLYYTAMRDIFPGEELRVWYAPHYAKKLGKPVEPTASITGNTHVH